MKWFVVAGFLVCFARVGSGSALKCSRSSPHPACSEKELQDDSTEDIKSDNEAESLEAECLVGSEWESNCHSCRCNSGGVAECAKMSTCASELVDLEPIRCKPNTSFQRDCNNCVCLDNGLGLCTLKFCRRTTSPTNSNLGTGKECAAGSRWRSRCNDCKCSPDGVVSCTDKACPGQEDDSEMRCAPESVWKSDCNTCWCEGGHAACTRRACVSFPVTMHFDDENTEASSIKKEDPEIDFSINDFMHDIVKRSVCKPNQSFQNDCNTCKCSSDGLTYRCTQNECMDKEDGVNKEVEVFMEGEGTDHIERHSVCRPQATFYIGCNTCHCNFDGTDYSCTNKPCPLPEDVELFHELKDMKPIIPLKEDRKKVLKSGQPKNKTIVCVANRMFIKDCNTCWCNEDGTGFFCTRRVCIPELPDEPLDDEKPEELRIIKKECRPDEVFEIDCNMCRCNPDGKSFSCTRRACFTESNDPVIEGVDVNPKNTPLSRQVRALPAPEPPKACQPGQGFRMDCNTCLCDNKGSDFSCTRIDCRAVNNNNNGGTRKKREVGQQAIKQCEPGSVFEQSCNVCRCTSDGHHASCTLKRCNLKPEEQKENGDSDLPESDPDFRCNPGEQFKRGCNDCTCSADGKSVFCTLRVCDKDLSPRL